MTAPPAAATALTRSYRPADTSVPLVDYTLGELLRVRAGEHPEHTALVGARSGTGETDRLSYAQLWAEACRAATGIRDLAKPGDFVALWAPNVVEWPVIEFGAALAGVTLVALNPVLRLEELDYALRHSGSTVLLHADRSRDYDLAAVAGQLRGSFPDLTTVSLSDRQRWCPDQSDPAVLADAPADPDRPVMLQYTSGTTGNPKGVLLRHRSLVNDAKLTMEAAGAKPGAVAVNPLPMFHTAACVIGTLGPLWLGGTQVLVEQFVPAPVLDTLRDERASILLYVPAVLGALLAEQKHRAAPPPRLDVLMGGAAMVPEDMIEAAQQVFGATVLNMFGQTELAPVLAATRPADSREDQLTTVGRPLPQVDCKVVNPVTGEIAPLGEEGEICARGYQQLIEYLHDPEATAATLDADGFVHTGDLGSMDERGYLKVTGRLKELIIRGGENIAPAAVESVIAGHPLVGAATVVGLPDQQWGEVVACVLRPAADPPADLVDQLIAYARERMSPYKVPTRWFLADGGLPVTPTGKVRKFQVRDQIQGSLLRELRAQREKVR
jgi:fatty-acyl-CoA synthase